MGDDNFKNINFPPLDLSHSISMASGIQSQIDENNRKALQVAETAYKNREKLQKAIEQTAANTAETNVRLEKVVENQNSYIDILKEQLSSQQKQLEFDEQQLAILKNIFASEEDGVTVEKEIWKLIQEQMDSSHPLRDFLKGKGGDIAVAGVTAGNTYFI